ncbi:hypothetical protein [Gottfriedia luciferensis]|uniref:hypothetical protein n=1 Tax=Gottfriedia luciferensis TaxID=178774 RepID=UPI000B436F07|nr:hypothetical protein [Gottfriedia luciferensis]
MDLGFGLADWMLYTIWAIMGLMILDFVIAFIRSFWKGSFGTSFILGYLKDILYFIFPLKFLISMFPLDPTGWILIAFYFVGGIAVVIKYLKDIVSKFK